MSEENQNVDKVDKWKKIITLVETKLWPLVVIAMAYIIYYQATWIKELTKQQHDEGKEYMMFFRDQYNETNKYLNYSRRNENTRAADGADTINLAEYNNGGR